MYECERMLFLAVLVCFSFSSTHVFRNTEIRTDIEMYGTTLSLLIVDGKMLYDIEQMKSNHHHNYWNKIWNVI